ncbi:MAG: glycolate oxidase subunit GlcE [Rhodospirillales bacterium]|nr:glycolate oxidase subunit GlcE [Rhodospirillales bacterium]
MQTFVPETASEAADVVRAALSENRSLEITGAGSKRGWGRPVAADLGLKLTALSGIELYEPEELVLTAKAGTPISEIERLLAEKDQALAFEPPDLSALYGGEAGDGIPGGTLGGVIGCNLSGPARIRSGAARDHVLGFEAIGGRGEVINSGGRVVKNVTGFDMPKAMAGSFGTLGVMTSITVRALPRAEKVRTVLIYGLDAARAADAMGAGLRSPHDIDGAAYLPEDLAARSAAGYVAGAAASVTALRLGGPGPSAEARCKALRGLLAPFGDSEELHGRNSHTFWREIRDVAPLFTDPESCIWRLSVAPASGAAILDGILAKTDGHAYSDWGGGLIWLCLAPGDDAGATAIRAAVAACGGHATLMRAADAVRAAVPVFQPQDPVSASLTTRLKEIFDPSGIFNPGRMYEGL